MVERPRRLSRVAVWIPLALSLACGPFEDSRRTPGPRQPTTTYSFSILEGAPPRVLFLGRERRAELVLRNDGYLAWPRETLFFFSPRWMGLAGDGVLEEGFRTPLAEDVPPGERTRLSVRMKPPAGVGLYRVHWDLQSESSGWFSRFDRTPQDPVWVLVLPQVEFFLAVLLPMLLLGVVVVLRRHNREASRWAATSVGLADLLWVTVSLLGKPYVLYGELAEKFWPGPKPVTFAVVAFLLLPLTVLPARIRATVAWCLAAFGALTVWTQVLYFRFFHDLASSVAALAGRQTTTLGSAVVSLAETSDLWLAIDLVAALPVLWLLAKKPRPGLSRAPRWVAAVLALLSIPFVWSGTRALASGQLDTRRNLQNLRSVSSYGLYGFQILDAGTRFVGRFRQPEIAATELEGLVEWFEASAGQRLAEGPSAGLGAGLNLIAIQVESMQGFVLDLDIGGVPVTPNLRRLRQEALDFSMMLDQTSRGRSSAGDFVTMTSLLPVGESIAYEHPRNEYYTIAHALADRGYRTVSAIPYKGSFWNRQVTHASYGFETSLFQDRFVQRGPKVGWGINDRDFFEQITPVLEGFKEPFFAWLTTLSVHFPYESFPGQLETLQLGELEGTSLGNYLHGMNFFDRALGEFLDRLRRTGLLESSVIAIWSDHASGLERDPGFIDFVGLDSPAEKFLFRRVPFIVRLPADRQLAARDESPAGQVDVAPTLLALLGVDAGDLAMMGRNLLAGPAERFVVHPQGRWTNGDLLFLSQFADDDGGCWSLAERARIQPRRCAAGTAAAERQLDVVSLVLEHDLQAEIARRLRTRAKR